MRSATALFAVLMFSCSVFAAENPRIFVTDSQSWEIGAGAGGSSDGFGASGGGGARPQTAEIVKTFHERCPNAIVNNRRDKADYVVVLDHEGGKDAIRRDNKIAIFSQSSGDAIFSRSTRSLGNAVKDGCGAIFRDWSRQSAREARKAAAAEEAALDNGGAEVSATVKGARVQVGSAPAGADIEIDGAFVGNTPSSIHLSPGEHRVVVKKNGFEIWERTVRISGGEVSLMAELKKR